MKTVTILVAILISLAFLVMVLFVAFGQITVRKLRKAQETRNQLGFELLSGWDIINAAQALSIPQGISQNLRDSPLSSLYANSSMLYKNTNAFDRVLARAFYWSMIFTGIFGAMLVILNGIGIFK